MSLTTRAGLLAGAAALTLTGAGVASTTTDANTDQLRAQVEQLQSRIAELESRQGDNWLTERRAAEIRSLVHDVLADADTRASLLGSGMQAGYDGGFTVGDAAGNFLLRINGQIQARWVYSYQREPGGFQSDLADLLAGVDDVDQSDLFALLDDERQDRIDNLQDVIDDLIADDPIANADAIDALVAQQDALAAIDIGGAVAGLAAYGGIMPNLHIGSDDRHRSGFENSRTKLFFSGHVLNPNWQYQIEGDFGRTGGLRLLDAYIAHNYGDTGLKIAIGQFRLPFLRETLIDSRYQQAVERSLVNSYFTVGLSQGIQVAWESDMIRAWGAFSDGMNQSNTPWQTGPEDGSTEWAFTVRGEVLLGGTWDQFQEFRSAPGEEFGILVGAAIHAQRGEYGTDFGNETQVYSATVDGHVKFGGANIYAAGVWRNIDVHGGGNFVQWGALVQGGFHFTPDWELFGRYEFADLDLPDLGAIYSFDDLHLVTVGVNHYMFGAGSHSAKWTTDVGYAWNRVELGDHRTGWRSDFGGKRGQFVLRSQVQLAF